MHIPFFLIQKPSKKTLIKFHEFQQDILSYCSMKSAPILLLALLSYTGQDFEGKLRQRCALGFLFGAIGDFLLSTNEIGFRLGSISFGIGHLCFIVSFCLKGIFFAV
jgi:uncharacterized membrane protein YhhN